MTPDPVLGAGAGCSFNSRAHPTTPVSNLQRRSAYKLAYSPQEDHTKQCIKQGISQCSSLRQSSFRVEVVLAQ